MPLVRIDHAAGKPPAYRAAISQGVHDAMTSTFNVPEDDRFQVIGEHPPGAVVHAPSYLRNRLFRRSRHHSDHLQRGPNARPEETPVRGPRRQSGRQPRPAARGHRCQPGRGQEGKLVVRQWRRPVRDVASKSQAVDQSAESQDDIGRHDEPEGVRGYIFDLKARARDACDRQ